MALFEKYYNSPKSGSSGVSDFDLPYAYQDLNNEQVGNARSVWKTPLWLNFLTGGVSCSMGYAVWFAYQYNPLSLQTIWIAKFLLVLIGCLFSCASIFLAVFSVFRGQLVLDKNLRELRFDRFWFRRALTDALPSTTSRPCFTKPCHLPEIVTSRGETMRYWPLHLKTDAAPKSLSTRRTILKTNSKK